MGQTCGCGDDNPNDLGYMDMEKMTRAITDQKEEDALPLDLEYYSKDSDDDLQFFDPGRRRVTALHCVEIVNKNRIKVKGNGKIWQTMITDKIIKSETKSTFTWKYTLNEFSTEIVIGWIDNTNNDISETMQDVWSRANYIGERDVTKQHGIRIFSNGIAGKFLINAAHYKGKTKEVSLTEEKYEAFKKKDVFEMQIDFEQNICTILYNGFIVGVAFQNQIANEIIPAISLHQTGSDVTISL